MRDSCGTSGQVETPNGAKRQEAHRTPRGKRATWSGNQPLSRTTEYKCKQKRQKNFSALGEVMPYVSSTFPLLTQKIRGCF
ncbi:hypothetical protein QUF49_06490 [Fictibacillus sp. b24]|uniref:hypothetical protein n=1 Tax=Fictibacillus sp. b24 TaxID=3055863 RepID=UPI0025A2C118|nr:hypothetical protein [Fictibacillus sp. b24]MDM5315640.1 hypothetical protein [Fictibacillus sp. b24]